MYHHILLLSSINRNEGRNRKSGNHILPILLPLKIWSKPFIIYFCIVLSIAVTWKKNKVGPPIPFYRKRGRHATHTQEKRGGCFLPEMERTPTIRELERCTFFARGGRPLTRKTLWQGKDTFLPGGHPFTYSGKKAHPPYPGKTNINFFV